MTGLDRLRGVGDEVEEHLVDLRGRARDRRNLAELLLYLMALQLMLREQQCTVEALIEIDGRNTAAIEAGEVPEIGDDVGNLLDAVKPVVGKLLQLLEHMVFTELSDQILGERELPRELVGILDARPQ